MHHMQPEYTLSSEFHVYKSLWQPVVEEMLILRKEPTYEKGSLAVSVLKEGQLVGHVPWNLAPLLFFFLDRCDSCASKPWSRHAWE